jgi:hypothetical protein
MRDRFTDACLELAGQSAYACRDCETTYGHPTFMHLDTMPNHPVTHDPESRDAACLFNCDPVPFGD